MHVGIANQAFAAFVLREYCKAPLRTSVRLITVERLSVNEKKERNALISVVVGREKKIALQ